MNSSKNPEEAFTLKINDRRRFDEAGNVRQGSSSEEENQVKSEASDPLPPSSPRPSETPSASTPKTTHPQFHSLILSLAVQAQSSLGLLADPETGQAQVDLAHTQQLIDWLGALEEKTAGNLSAEERQLLQGLLYELRLAYVQLQPGEKK